MKEFLRVTKALSDETRVRALMTLREGELCLCQIIEVLGLAPSTVSKHMHTLQGAGLVERRKQGKWHYYRLTDTETDSIASRLVGFSLEALARSPTIRADSRSVRTVRRQDLEELSACYR